MRKKKREDLFLIYYTISSGFTVLGAREIVSQL